MKMYKVETWFGSYDVVLKVARYGNGNLAIQMEEMDHSPFARLTVNLLDKLPDSQAYVDTNNCPWAVEFISENGLGRDTGETKASGFCVYQLYEFDLEKLMED
jgi:hypothetical protein